MFEESASLLRLRTILLKGADRRLSATPNAVLYREGDSAQSLFFLESGLIKLLCKLDQDRDVLVRFIRMGDFFGERCLLETARRPATALVVQDSQVCEFTRASFHRLCRRNQDLWTWYLEMSAKRLEETERRVQLVSFYKVEHRILYALCDLAAAIRSGNGSNRRISIPLSQGELADLVGATRETTSSTLNSLARRGLVELGRRNVTIPSCEVLMAAAGH